MEAPQARDRLWWGAVGAIALAGVALRLAAARGGLWTDEAWSVIYAAQARDPIGVFLRINHDNNHHLYSLWLQAIGPTAAPMLARAPAILASSLSIAVAAVFAGRKSTSAGLVAALLFAFSPILVTLGSEARGYAMMLLAALTLLLLVGDAVDGRSSPATPWWLALLSVLGMFSHLTMAAPVMVAVLWFYLERRASFGPRPALTETIRLLGPAIGATTAVVLFVFAAAAFSPTGMRVGGYEPFEAVRFAAALDDLSLWSIGIGAPKVWIVPLALGLVAVAVAVGRPAWLGHRARLYALLVLLVPVGAWLLRAGNTGFARYYLATAVGLLLFMSEWIGRGLTSRPAVRASAALLLIALTGVNLDRDSQLIAVGRGHPAQAVADIASLSPEGAHIAFAEPRLKAVVAVAAGLSGYDARFAGGCAPAQFLLAAQSRWTPTPAVVHRCGVRMKAVDSSVTVPLTGDSWVLYRSTSLANRRGR